MEAGVSNSGKPVERGRQMLFGNRYQHKRLKIFKEPISPNVFSPMQSCLLTPSDKSAKLAYERRFAVGKPGVKCAGGVCPASPGTRPQKAV